MTGFIRIVAGLIITMGGVGALDNPESGLLIPAIVSILGIIVLISGVNAAKNK
jgi:hypothetical protein